MTNEQPSDAPRPNQSTGPKTPEGKVRCRLNAYRHGLTGKLCVFTPEEQQAYEKHSRIVLEGLSPVGDYERDIAQSIADACWRLKRASAIDAATFALGMQRSSSGDSGHPEVDNAFSQAQTWGQSAHNLQLLTVYEQRIQRACDKNTARLEAIQAKRKAEAKEAMRQATLLYQLAQAEGKPYQPESYFSAAPEVRESVFSTLEVAREFSRGKLLEDATTHHATGRFPEKDEHEQPVEASAGNRPNSATPQSIGTPTLREWSAPQNGMKHTDAAGVI